MRLIWVQAMSNGLLKTFVSVAPCTLHLNAEQENLMLSPGFSLALVTAT